MLRAIRHTWTLRVLTALAVATSMMGTGLTAPSSGDLQSQISTAKSAAGSLQSQIAAESEQIATTTNGLRQAEARLAVVQGQLNQRVAELKAVQGQLTAARDHLVALENRLHAATTALAANLLAGYENAPPDLVTVILNSHGFGDLLNQVSFMGRVAHQNTSIVGFTRAARAEVARQANHLADLEDRDRTLADQVLSQRNQVATLQLVLAHRRDIQLAARGSTGRRLSAVQGRIGSLQSRLNRIEARIAAAAQARAAAAARAASAGSSSSSTVSGVAVDTGGMVQAPAGAPEAVRQVIAAGNAIAGLPYIWGGGHGSFHASGYDCSGSVSYALAAAGLVSSPMVSGDFESWGAPGPGRWITVYANAGHVWMEVAGWRFDTVALSTGGTRWSQGGGEFSGFVVRHPPGL